LTRTPPAKLTTRKPRAKVSFSFVSATEGAVFECSVDGVTFKACAPGIALRARPGRHTFAVRAVFQGLPDPTPATYAFRVKRTHRR
jgi:hypothetical protein